MYLPYSLSDKLTVIVHWIVLVICSSQDSYLLGSLEDGLNALLNIEVSFMKVLSFYCFSPYDNKLCHALITNHFFGNFNSHCPFLALPRVTLQ